MVIIAMRDHAGGSLGLTPQRYGEGMSVYAFQFVEKDYFYGIVLLSWVFGIWVWNRVDSSMARYSMEAISDDEDASASVGINVTRELRAERLDVLRTQLHGVAFTEGTDLTFGDEALELLLLEAELV